LGRIIVIGKHFLPQNIRIIAIHSVPFERKSYISLTFEFAFCIVVATFQLFFQFTKLNGTNFAYEARLERIMQSVRPNRSHIPGELPPSIYLSHSTLSFLYIAFSRRPEELFNSFFVDKSVFRGASLE